MTKVTEKDMLQKQPLLEPDTVDNLTSVKATNRLARLLLPGKKRTYDPSIVIPKTSDERLQAAAHDHALDINALLHDHGPNAKPPPQTQASVPGEGADKPEETVLYLAYGSNMSAQSFRESRGILPLSQLNRKNPQSTRRTRHGTNRSSAWSTKSPFPTTRASSLPKAAEPPTSTS
ncbi:hypothetical protein EMPG_15366 [Blastomyces silverae]|uniref:Uncharacterized protein n=1 Tax=Blastomyces silverae TaxID=2060906 RepID=A0A0H1BDT1_9EURO|nr:hypothetical protein EMPG_15366 [Blastomyces silverae]